MEPFEDESLYHIFMDVIRLHYYRTHTLLDEIGVYPGQPPMLFALSKKDGQSQTELSEELNLKPSTITVMLKRMEKAELVERRVDMEDQRISRVYITEKGRTVFEEVNRLMDIIKSECFDNFTMEELVLLRRLLMQMRDNLMKAIDDKDI
ncbi:MarR family winged helix-turn-helix transcriptional regulator [Xylanivirga thermophila]|mgnify:CR=1 FL=1|jgi:DNA-binding MarR family transcriptional regulator|uniref:MarR family winged helix-turn-helix transcriptional regulator n=1 Tax=Xylanivirga thermophila TaxID=2496273 RepID=UPI00101D5B31|nr:MarR family transcriptional regulator [Xylanivirga thermophila]